MNRKTEAIVIILFGLGFGLISIFLSQIGFLGYILLAISICLTVYGAYLYASDFHQKSN